MSGPWKYKKLNGLTFENVSAELALHRYMETAYNSSYNALKLTRFPQKIVNNTSTSRF
jgi:hypothetical protein